MGLTRILNEGQAAGSTTMRARTPSFKAPEEIRWDSLIDKCDVYVLGGTITDLFGERPLWPSMSIHQVPYKVEPTLLYIRDCSIKNLQFCKVF